jgi:hypothetical protein
VIVNSVDKGLLAGDRAGCHEHYVDSLGGPSAPLAGLSPSPNPNLLCSGFAMLSPQPKTQHHHPTPNNKPKPDTSCVMKTGHFDLLRQFVRGPPGCRW